MNTFVIKEHTIVADLLQQGDLTIVDLGACLGEFTTELGRCFSIRLAVLVEPIPANFNRIEPATGRILINKAVAAQSGNWVSIAEDLDSPYNGSIVFNYFTNRRRHMVETISLRDILLLMACDGDIDILKVDIEGSEYELLLNSSSEDLLRFRQITVEFHDFVDQSMREFNHRIEERLKSLGFSVISNGTSYWNGSDHYDTVFYRPLGTSVGHQRPGMPDFSSVEAASLPDSPLRHMAIITHGRTGSTMLQYALNQSPGVLVRGENHNAVFGMYLTYSALSRARSVYAHAHSPDAPWFGAPGLKVEELLRSQQAAVKNCILRPEPGTRLLGWKEIRHIPLCEGVLDHNQLLPKDFEDLVAYLAYLDLLFPGIRFLVAIRKPESACRSSWWGGNPERSLRILSQARDWLVAVPDALATRLNRRAAVLVEYESWIANPDCLREAWSFLEIPWDGVRIGEIFSRRINAT